MKALKLGALVVLSTIACACSGQAEEDTELASEDALTCGAGAVQKSLKSGGGLYNPTTSPFANDFSILDTFRKQRACRESEVPVAGFGRALSAEGDADGQYKDFGHLVAVVPPNRAAGTEPNQGLVLTARPPTGEFGTASGTIVGVYSFPDRVPGDELQYQIRMKFGSSTPENSWFEFGIRPLSSDDVFRLGQIERESDTPEEAEQAKKELLRMSDKVHFVKVTPADIARLEATYPKAGPKVYNGNDPIELRSEQGDLKGQIARYSVGDFYNVTLNMLQPYGSSDNPLSGTAVYIKVGGVPTDQGNQPSATVSAVSLKWLGSGMPAGTSLPQGGMEITQAEATLVQEMDCPGPRDEGLKCYQYEIAMTVTNYNDQEELTLRGIDMGFERGEQESGYFGVCQWRVNSILGMSPLQRDKDEGATFRSRTKRCTVGFYGGETITGRFRAETFGQRKTRTFSFTAGDAEPQINPN